MTYLNRGYFVVYQHDLIIATFAKIIFQEGQQTEEGKIGGKMTIKDAVAEIIRLKGKDIFKDKKIFFALLGDLAPEYPKELKIIRNNFDEDIFKLFIDENKKNSHKVRLFYSSLDDLGVAEDKIYFFLESFGIPLGWEQEILDFKVDSPMQVSNYEQQATKQSVDENVKKSF